MATILKHGKKYIQDVIICHECGCEFSVNDNEKEDYRDGYKVCCPECGELTSCCSPKESRDKTRMDKCIDDIINEETGIDFERIHIAMKALNWAWGTSQGGYEIPTVDELKREARRLLEDAWVRKSTISTGGFIAEYHKYDDGDVELKLIFAIENWSAIIDENDKIIYY